MQSWAIWIIANVKQIPRIELEEDVLSCNVLSVVCLHLDNFANLLLVSDFNSLI